MEKPLKNRRDKREQHQCTDLPFAAFAALGQTFLRALSPHDFRELHPHVSSHIFAPLALQKLRLGHLGTKAVLSQKPVLLGYIFPLSK